MNNLSIHKSKFHKSYLVKQEDHYSIAESALDMSLHVFPLVNKDEIILFDLDKEEIIENFSDSDKVNIKNYSPETLICKGFYPNQNSLFEISESIVKFHFEGGDFMDVLMSENEESSRLWDNSNNLYQSGLFNLTLENRIDIEKEIRKFCNIGLKSLNLNSPFKSLLNEIVKSNITDLILGWVYLSDDDLILLSNCENLEYLTLVYNFNNNFLKFPKNLIYLRIYGTTVESLSEINLTGLKLETLDLEGNTISDLQEISKLPDSIVELSLTNNHIKNFYLKDLHENIECLSLDDNQIENSFFEGDNLGIVKSNLKTLLLPNNNFTVNTWLLNRILETFPNLEYLELSGNKTDGIPEEFLINDEKDSCLDKIKFYLKPQVDSVEFSYGEITNEINRYNNAHHISLKWKHDSLPEQVIISDIQYQFKRYLGAMPKFRIFKNGIYCDIEQDEISIMVRTENESGKSIFLEFYASNSSNFKSYYYAYFHKIFELIRRNTHHSILPIASFSDQCEIYQEFYNQIYRFNIKHKSNDILRIKDEDSYLLIKSVKKGYLDIIGEFYKNINEVAFVVITTKNALIYTIDQEFSIGNTKSCVAPKSKNQKREPYNLSIRSSEEKTNYINAITNPYLGINCLKKGNLHINNEVGQKISIYYNPVFFFAFQDNIHCHFQQIKANDDNLCEPIISGKNLIISFENNKIQAKYSIHKKKGNHSDS